MRAAVVVIGDEILSGYTQDTNTHWLAERLHLMGLPLVEVRIVPDIAARIQGSVWELQERRDVDIVITCGGLGPTHDDRTVAALAALHGAPLVRDERTWAWLAERYARLHKEGKRPTGRMTAASEKMALVPKGAEVYANAVGAAPGLFLRRAATTRSTDVFTLVLPGVPRELRSLWEEHLGPRIASLAGDRLLKRHVRTLVFRGYESEAAEVIGETEKRHPEVAVGSYPQSGKSEVLLRVSGTDPRAVEAAVLDLRDRMDAAGHPVEGPTEAASPNA